MPDRKELHYFSNDGTFNYKDEGSLSLYMSFFSRSKAYCLVGEATPSYIYNDDSARNIFNAVPDVKLIVTLRQPAERAYSHWRMLRKRNAIPLESSFRESFYGNGLKQVGMRRRGFYHTQLLRYFEFFERENMLILTYDELTNNYGNYLKKIYSFLNINNEFLSHSASKVLLPRLPNIMDIPTIIPKVEKDEITNYYLCSINKLETLLDINLSDWKL